MSELSPEFARAFAAYQRRRTAEGNAPWIARRHWLTRWAIYGAFAGWFAALTLLAGLVSSGVWQ